MSDDQFRWHAVGRRKTSVARVYLTPGTGKWEINGRTLGDYFPRPSLVQHIQQPFTATDTLGAFDPFFQHAEADYFIAERDGEVVGRIAAIGNRLHNEVHEDRVGFFGFFECINDFRVAQALFDTAAEWLRARGFDTMRGPMSFSTNDECGVLIDGFDTPNTLMMPHNPPYYLTLM